MFSIFLTQLALAADPSDWNYVNDSCDTDITGISDDLSGVTVDGMGQIWGVENGAGLMLQLNGVADAMVATLVNDPDDVIKNYDAEGITWVDSSVTPSGAGNYFAVAWEKDPMGLSESGMTILNVVGNNLVEVATIELLNINNGSGNMGMEGIVFASAESDASNWVFYGVKESPAELFRIIYNVTTKMATATSQGLLDIADAAGIAINPTDSSKAFVLTESGADLITEVNLVNGVTTTGAGVLNPSTNADGCFSQPEGLATAPGLDCMVDLIIVGEATDFARFDGVTVESNSCAPVTNEGFCMAVKSSNEKVSIICL